MSRCDSVLLTILDFCSFLYEVQKTINLPAIGVVSLYTLEANNGYFTHSEIVWCCSLSSTLATTVPTLQINLYIWRTFFCIRQNQKNSVVCPAHSINKSFLHYQWIAATVDLWRCSGHGQHHNEVPDNHQIQWCIKII